MPDGRSTTSTRTGWTWWCWPRPRYGPFAMRIGVMSASGMSGSLDELIDEARRADADGFHTFWMAQIFGLDALTALSVVGREVPAASSSARPSIPTYPRAPDDARPAGAHDAAGDGGRLALGIGHQPPDRGRGDVGHVVRQAGAPRARVPERADADARGQAGLVRRRDVQGARRGRRRRCRAAVRGGGRARPADAAAVRRDDRRHLDVVRRTRHAEEPHRADARPRRPPDAGRPTPRIVCMLPICVTDDVDGARARRPSCSRSTTSCRATAR